MAMSSEVQSSPTEKTRVLAQVRHGYILEAIVQHGAVSVADVAAQLGVSEMTVRRDLIELEKDGKLARTHGGAVRSGATPEPEPPLEPREAEPTFQSRLSRNAAAKRAIAAAAASLAFGARTIALDVGTTTFLLADHLADRQHVKVFTNSVRAAARLGDGLAEVYLPGGRMRGDELSISSPTAVAQFEGLWFDMAFIGVSGLNAEGIYDYSFDDTDLKRVYLQRSTQKVVLCDSGKFGRLSLVHIAPLKQFDMLITDQAPPPELARALSAAGVTVRIAPKVAPLA